MNPKVGRFYRFGVNVVVINAEEGESEFESINGLWKVVEFDDPIYTVVAVDELGEELSGTVFLVLDDMVNIKPARRLDGSANLYVVETLSAAQKALSVSKSFSDRRTRNCRNCGAGVDSVVYHNGVQLYTRWLDDEEVFIVDCPKCGHKLSGTWSN